MSDRKPYWFHLPLPDRLKEVIEAVTAVANIEAVVTEPASFLFEIEAHDEWELAMKVRDLQDELNQMGYFGVPLAIERPRLAPLRQ